MTKPDNSRDDHYEYFPAARVGEVPANQGINVRLQGHLIGLFQSDGEYFAIRDFCPHQGAQLSGGAVEEGIVMCPWHAWRFRLSDGAWADSPNSPIRCATYPVKVEDETIHIGLPPDDRSQAANE